MGLEVASKASSNLRLLSKALSVRRYKCILFSKVMHKDILYFSKLSISLAKNTFDNNNYYKLFKNNFCLGSFSQLRYACIVLAPMSV